MQANVAFPKGVSIIDKYIDIQAGALSWSSTMERISTSKDIMLNENERIRSLIISSNHDAATIIREALSRLSALESSLRVRIRTSPPSCENHIIPN